MTLLGDRIPTRTASKARQDGEFLLLLPHTRRLAVLNRTAREIWGLCDGRRTVRQIITELTRRYRGLRVQDVIICLRDLERAHLVRL